MSEALAWETIGECPLCGHRLLRLWRQLPCAVAPEGRAAIVQCEACHLRFLNPRPPRAAVATLYTERYYAFQPSAEPPRSHRLKCRLWRALRLLPPRANIGTRALRALIGAVSGQRRYWLLPAWPESRFLDIGCGAGYRLDLARELGWETYGVDFVRAGLAIAQGQGHHVVQAAAEALPFRDEMFDYINLAHTLEHTYDPVVVLRECRRILRPTGCLQVVVPNAESWGARRYRENWAGLQPPYHFYHFTAQTLRRCAEAAGLRVRALCTWPNPWVLAESAQAAGEASPPRLGLLSYRLLCWRGYGENLNIWCSRQ